MRPLSVVQLFTHSCVTRGGAVQGLLLAQALNERGHRVVCFFHAPYDHNSKRVSSTFTPFGTSHLDIRWVNMKHPLSYFNFRRWLRHNKIDIIHAHRNLALLFGYFSTPALRDCAPILIVNRGTTYPLANPLVRRVFRSQRLDHVIVVAAAVKQALVKQQVLDPNKISVVYGSFDENRFHPDVDGSEIRREFQLDACAPLIVSVAAVDGRKGLEFLVRGAAGVIQKFPAAKFLLVGNVDDRHYYDRVQNEINQLGLRGRVVFTGHRTDVPEILAAADVSVNASTEGEGFTGALRESLAMRKAVVCTAVCGNPELIRHGESGWVVAPGNPRALAAAIVQALEHPEEARRRAEQGYREIVRTCSNPARCRQVEQIYLSLLRTRHSLCI